MKWVVFRDILIGKAETKEQAKEIVRNELQEMYENFDIDYQALEEGLEILETEDEIYDIQILPIEEYLEILEMMTEENE